MSYFEVTALSKSYGKVKALQEVSLHVEKGEDLQRKNSKLNEFGILIQADFFDYLNAQDNLRLLMKASGYTNQNQIRKKVNDMLELVGLSDKKAAYVKSFSFGMKQRLGLAQALLHDPHFLNMVFEKAEKTGSRIRDISIRENSLYDYFKWEVQDENIIRNNVQN